jgi:hypothetical protein
MHMHDFRAVISLWKPVENLADDIGQKGGTVRQWRLRNFIPPEHWSDVVAAARLRGFAGVTLELLAAFAARRRSQQTGSAA